MPCRTKDGVRQVFSRYFPLFFIPPKFFKGDVCKNLTLSRFWSILQVTCQIFCEVITLFKKWTAYFVAAACLLGLALPASAVEISAKGSQTTIYADIYDAQPPAGSTYSSIHGNTVEFEIHEKIVGKDQTNYTVLDSSPLHDSSLFSRKISIQMNPNYLRSLKPVENEERTGSCFSAGLTNDYLFENYTVGFDITYTARADAVLLVRAAGSDEPVEMQVPKGSVISCYCKLYVEGERIFI